MSYGSQVFKERGGMPDSMHVFYHTMAGFIASPNADYLPNIPIHSDTLDGVFDGLWPRYAYDDWFYLALVPRQVRYDHPLFECLAPLGCSLDRVDAPGSTGYRLREKLCEQWAALENITVHVQKRLLLRTAGTYLDTLAPPYPHWMGYQKIWKARPAALLAIRLARTAFTLRFAFISFLILKEMNAGRRPWEDLAADRDDPVPLSICNSFQASWICDFNVPRIGAIVPIGGQSLDKIGSSWHEHIPGLLTAGVPLWFSYGKLPTLGPNASKVTRNEHRRHLPSSFSVYVLKKAVEHACDLSSIRNDEVQRRREDNPRENLDERSFYGCIVQFNYSHERPTRVFVRQREHETFTYRITIVGHDAHVDLVDEVAPTHASVEAGTLQFRCRQAPSDTYDTFIEREQEVASRLALNETSTELARRMDRVATNSVQHVPAQQGPAVFAWVSEGQRQIRMRVEQTDVAALWARTTQAQRTYNSFRNEYDVLDISEETPDSTPVYEPSHSRDLDRPRSVSPVPRQPRIFRPRTPPRGSPSTSSSLPAQPMPKIVLANEKPPANLMSSEHLSEMARTLLLAKDGNDLLSEEAMRKIETDSLRDILIHRYGYCPPERTWKAVTDEGRQWTQGQGVTKLYRSLGHWDRQDNLTSDGVPTEELEPLADFVVMVKRDQPPPREISDLSRVASRLLSQPSNHGLQVSRYELANGSSPPMSWYMLRLLNGVMLDTSGRCRMLVNMATNVLHLQRGHFGQSGDTILESLLHRGIRVRLLRAIDSTVNIVRPRERVSTLGERPLGIGIKPHGIELTRDDYKVYMRMRDELLRGPAGCAALLEGGIMWRLSRSTCSIEETIKGPDIDVNNAHGHLQVLNIGGQDCIESTLSQQDQYIIAGVYRILQPSSKEGRAPQSAAITSWWPTSEIWASSGYATGYWSHAAEVWFQRRLARLKAGDAKPMSSNEWRNSLRHTVSDSQKFIAGIEKLSTRMISTVIV